MSFVFLALVVTDTACDVAVFENRQHVSAAEFINKSSLFIQLPGVIRRLELKPIKDTKDEKFF